MDFLVLTKTGGILGPFATVLGFIMNYIDKFLGLFGVNNVALTIIIFTFVVNLLMMPLTIKQQKFTKLSAVMNPELQKLQKKYAGKRDQASVAKMQAEQQAIYKKYGTSPTGGCLFMLIQLPILFALYRVIYNVPAYVDSIRVLYEGIAQPIMTATDGASIATSLMETLNIANIKNFDIGNVNTVIDMLSQVSSTGWSTVSSAFSATPAVVEAVSEYSPQIIQANSLFGGLNIADAPLPFSLGLKGMLTHLWPGILIPALSGISQWVNMKVSMANQPKMDDNPMGGSMKTMNNIMPILSFVMCCGFAAGLGIYWIASAVFRTLSTVVVNKYFDKKDLDEIIAENREKAAKKAEKRGGAPSKFEEYATKNTKAIEAAQQAEKERKGIKDLANTSTLKSKESQSQNDGDRPVKNEDYKSGSIAGYANMLKHKDKE